MSNKIFVTQPFLPSLEEFQPYLEQIWNNKWLTNNGPFHQQFEEALSEYLGVPYVSLFANGTMALLTALQALNIEGEVITTPYTFVATAHALVWNKLTPVFVDVDPIHGNLDPNKIEEAINDKTSAILPVHVYGNPCEADKIEKIAKVHDLKVIYDAAHAFGVEKDKESILNKGDLSVLSFHATKVFNTFEGGAIISHSPEMKHHIDNLKNFGFRGETIVEEVGINGKMNELQAAMGILQLKHIDTVIEKRKILAQIYSESLSQISGIRTLVPDNRTKWNYAYFPIFVEDNFKWSRDELYERLKKDNIYARRYFYPIVPNFKAYQAEKTWKKFPLPNAEGLSKKVISLPIYPDLSENDLKKIIAIICK